MTLRRNAGAGAVLALAFACSGSALFGCALLGIGTEAQFRKEALPRAATEIACDERKVIVTDLGDKRVAIEGCGRRAQYQYLEPGGWIRDTGTSHEAMPGTTPAPTAASTTSATSSASAPPSASASAAAPPAAPSASSKP
ncbi:MAG: hypothetical protein JST00_36475 [Deltaproteobacteria bacterium]|nr:hypothetical protein [Deltaproteobacteria bacterium]